MKPTKFTTGRLLLALLITGLTIGLVSWDHQRAPGHYRQSINDTVPKTRSSDKEKKIRDLDDVLDELNNADLKVNMEKVQKEFEEAMKKIDGNKIKLEMEKAMKEIDMAKIQKEVQESMATVDWSKIKEEVANALKEVDMVKIEKEVKESMAKINWDELKEEMNKVKEVDMKEVEKQMEKVKEEMKDLGPTIEKEMQKANVEIEKAKVEIKEYKEFVNGLESDGLINKKEGYDLKHKDGELFINGKKASEQVYNKYRSFLEKHKKFSMKKGDDDFDINMD